MDTSVVCDDSDSEVFEVGVSTPAAIDDHQSMAAGIINTVTAGAGAAARMTSSSSSSCCDDGHSKTSSHASPEPTLLLDGGSHSSSSLGGGGGGQHAHHGHVHHHHHHHHHTVSGPTVEWRPMNSGKSAGEIDNGGSSGSGMMLRNSRVVGKTSTNDDLHVQSPQDHHNNIHDYGGIVTVMIDPPSDNRQLYAESAAAAVDLGSKLVFRCPSASDEESIDLFADLDDSDSEGEEAEGGTTLMKTCLLSR